MFEHIDWSTTAIPFGELPTLPNLNGLSAAELTERIKNLVPVMLDSGEIYTCGPVDMTANRVPYLGEADTIKKLDDTCLTVVHQSFTQHTYRFYGMFKPDLVEVAYHLPMECWGKHLFLLLEGPETSEDLYSMKVHSRGVHIARMTLFAAKK